MKFLNHDINRTLLGLIIFFLIFFIVSSIYYEISLKKILNNKNGAGLNENRITAQLILESLNERLNDSDRMKKIALIDKEWLEEKYENLLIQNEALSKEKISLKEEINLLKSQLEYQKVKLEGPSSQFMLIQGKNQQIRLLKEKTDALCLLLQSKNVSTDECS